MIDIINVVIAELINENLFLAVVLLLLLGNFYVCRKDRLYMNKLHREDMEQWRETVAELTQKQVDAQVDQTKQISHLQTDLIKIITSQR